MVDPCTTTLNDLITSDSYTFFQIFFSCWMSVEKGTVFAFVVPVLVIILVIKTIRLGINDWALPTPRSSIHWSHFICICLLPDNNYIKKWLHTCPQINVVFLFFAVRSLLRSKKRQWSTQQLKKKAQIITLVKWGIVIVTIVVIGLKWFIHTGNGVRW